MKKTFTMSIILLSSGLVIGGGCSYLVHLAISNIVHHRISNNDTSNLSETGLVSTEKTRPTEPTETVSDMRDSISTSGISTLSILDPSLEQNSFQRMLAIYSYVANLSEQQITAELTNTTGTTQKLSKSILSDLQIALIEKLTIVNPTAAVTIAVDQKELSENLFTPAPWDPWQYAVRTTDTTPMPLVRSVFKEWALSNLDNAVSSAKSLKKDARSNALAGILEAIQGESLTTYRTIAKKLGDEDQGLESYVMSFSSVSVENPKAIWDEIVSLIEPENYEQYQVLGNIAQQWYQQEGLGVLEEISSGTLDENVKGDVVNRVLVLASEEDPDLAFRYALTMPTQGNYSSPLYSVIGAWAVSDPQAAFHAVSGIEQSGQRDTLQGNVVSIWAYNEPYYLLENLDLFPPKVRVQGISSALAKIAQTSPQEAAELALEQKSIMLGSLSYLPNQIMAYWLRTDVEGAVNWAFNGPLSEENRQSWVSALVTTLVNSDPRRAFELALKQPISEVAMDMYKPPALEARIMGQIVYNDLDLAVELLPRVREGTSRSQAYSSVGNKYIHLGETTKAVELGKELSPDEQASYFQTIAYSWVRVDPSGMVESFESIPTDELRSSLARSFLEPWMNENFTESQLDVLRQYLNEADRKALEK